MASNLPDWFRKFLKHRDVDLRRYRFSVDARRDQLLKHYGVDVLVDIGANEGQYAHEARFAGFAGQIVSVEPVSVAFKQLRAAAADDPRWETHQVAVGARQGALTMQISELTTFSSALPLLAEGLEAAPAGKIVDTEEVPMTTLDDLVGDYSGTLAVKMDVQGFERDVLDGGSKTLERAVMLEMEMSPTPVYAGQMLMDEALARMSDAGFTLALTENVMPDGRTGRALQFNGIFIRV
jgi:FkbM family methyltransferase